MIVAASFPVEVVPDVLIWMRKAAGLRPDEVARKLSVDEASVRSWEAGIASPTLSHLRKLCKIYRRPLAAFLLDAPPPGKQTLRDFRRAFEAGDITPELRNAFREVEERRSIAIELQDALREEVSSFDEHASLDDDPELTAARLRAALAFTPADQRALRSDYEALSRWRQAVEARGVLVFGFASVDEHEARAFSLSESPLPAIALNNKDAPYGRLFSLLHELTHIALRSGFSLCDLSDEDGSDPRVEQFCNHVAGAMLVPEHMLLEVPEVARATSRTTWTADQVQMLARAFQVSREVVLRRLLILERTNRTHYEEWRERLRTEPKRKTGGGSYYANRISQLGRLYPHLVFAAHERELISSSSASTFLETKINHFEKLIAQLMAGPGSDAA